MEGGGSSPGGKAAVAWRWPLRQVLRLRMSGAMSTLLYLLLWCGKNCSYSFLGLSCILCVLCCCILSVWWADFQNVENVRGYRFCYLSPYSLVVGRDSSGGIATRYGLDRPGIESRWGEIFRTCPDRPWCPPSLLYNGYRVFPGGKAAGVWRWTPTPILRRS
jgi:hypothetical protein